MADAGAASPCEEARVGKVLDALGVIGSATARRDAGDDGIHGARREVFSERLDTGKVEGEKLHLRRGVCGFRQGRRASGWPVFDRGVQVLRQGPRGWRCRIAHRAQQAIARPVQFAGDVGADVSRGAREQNRLAQDQRPSMVRATSSRMISEEPP